MKNNRGHKKNTFTRLIKTLFEFYPVLLPIIIALILFNSVVSSIPSIFMQNIIAVIEKYWRTKDWLHAKPEVLSFVTVLLILYILSLIASFTYNRLIAVVTQGSLMKFREKMFARMESLPIRYFDTNAHGDIMSIYTNDTDTLRQLISQSLPALMQTSIVLLTVFSIMIYYSFWLTGVVLIGCVIMFCTVDHQVIVIFIEHQSDRLHNIVVVILTVHLVSVGIQIKVVEDDFLFLLDSIL